MVHFIKRQNHERKERENQTERFKTLKKTTPASMKTSFIHRSHQKSSTSSGVEDPKTLSHNKMVFASFDTEALGELSLEQLRMLLEKTRSLFFTDEEIKKILSEILQYSQHLPFSDFRQFIEFVENNKDALRKVCPPRLTRRRATRTQRRRPSSSTS